MIGSKRIEYEVEGDLVSMNEQFLNDTLQDLHLGQKKLHNYAREMLWVGCD